MSAIPITLFFSLLLAGGFVFFFLREQRQRRFASAERDSLLPLAEEDSRLASTAPEPTKAHGDDDGDHDHDHDHHHGHGEGGCGCRNGTRAPCPGCLRRAPVADPAAPASPGHATQPR